MKLSIVIPAYNEEQMVGKTCRVLHEVLSGAGISYELVLVNDGSKDNYLAGRGELNYKYRFSENVEFKQMISYLSSFEDGKKYFAVSDSAIGVKMTQNLSLGVSYNMDYTNKTEKEKLDTKFLTSLIVDF
jgi:putative salt-induced outer membrane protein